MDHLSTRIAFLCIMTSSLLIYNYYSTSIVSSRLNEQIFKINDSLNELSKSKLKVASEWMEYFEFFIKVSSKIRKSLSCFEKKKTENMSEFYFQRADWETEIFFENKWKLVPEKEKFMVPEKALPLVAKGGFAYHTHPDVGYPYIGRFYENREICELTEVHLARPTLSAFAVNYNSTFVEILRIGYVNIF